MNRELKNIILFLLFFSSFAIQAIPIDFACSVKNFTVLSETGSGSDEFIERNLKKKFIISIDQQEVIVTSISDTYSSGINKYKIFDRDIYGSVKAERRRNKGVIFIDPKTGEATISLQGSSYLNAWLLDCKKQ